MKPIEKLKSDFQSALIHDLNLETERYNRKITGKERLFTGRNCFIKSLYRKKASISK